MQRFLLGVEFGLDGTLRLAPVAPKDFWNMGFGQTLTWRGRTLSYRVGRERVTGDYSGEAPQRLAARLLQPARPAAVHVTINGVSANAAAEDGAVVVTLPAASVAKPCRFEIRQDTTGASAARR